jgi:hypothetical protein
MKVAGRRHGWPALVHLRIPMFRHDVRVVANLFQLSHARQEQGLCDRDPGANRCRHFTGPPSTGSPKHLIRGALSLGGRSNRPRGASRPAVLRPRQRAGFLRLARVAASMGFEWRRPSDLDFADGLRRGRGRGAPAVSLPRSTPRPRAYRCSCSSSARSTARPGHLRGSRTISAFSPASPARHWRLGCGRRHRPARQSSHCHNH